MIKIIKSFLLENKTDKQTIIKNTFWLMVAEFFSKWWMFLVTILIARILWPEQFWILSFVTSFVAMFIVITDFWLTTLMVREVSKDHSKIQEYLVNLSFLKVILWIITFILVWIVSWFIWKDEIYMTLILIYCWYAIINNFWEFIRAFFRPSEKMQYEALLKIINWVLFLWIVWFSLFHYWDLISIVYAFLISWVLNLIISLVYVVWKFEIGKVRLSKSTIKSSLKSWIYLMGGMLAINMFNYIDQIMIWFMRTEQELWYYSAAYKIVWITVMISVLFANTIIPKMSKLILQKEKLNDFIKKIIKNIFFLVIFFLTINYLLSWLMIKLILWKEYLIISNTYLILSLSIIPVILNNIYWNILIIAKKETSFLMSVIIWLILNIVLNLIFIPKYWINAAAVSTVFTETIVFILYFYNYKKLFWN